MRFRTLESAESGKPDSRIKMTEREVGGKKIYKICPIPAT